MALHPRRELIDRICNEISADGGTAKSDNLLRLLWSAMHPSCRIPRGREPLHQALADATGSTDLEDFHALLLSLPSALCAWTLATTLKEQTEK
ncbi:hypothetical protein OUO20_18475 [Arthrobacter sp. FX8]|nr:hypothetical protein [Arthrobacter sp. FX8]WAJ33018.1 hypothetical protein OUO20_18475 [Arthrobacter sp. FX8]